MDGAIYAESCDRWLGAINSHRLQHGGQEELTQQTLSSSRINLLILDETVETLDTDGKEKLVEVLLQEEHLNTFLVSHGFSHPLLEKINVIKRNNISQIEV